MKNDGIKRKTEPVYKKAMDITFMVNPICSFPKLKFISKISGFLIPATLSVNIQKFHRLTNVLCIHPQSVNKDVMLLDALEERQRQ